MSAVPPFPVIPLSTPTELNLATSGTYDITQVNLIGGIRYAFLAAGATEGGGTLHDPFMAILSPTKVQAFQDNSILSLDPLILFTPPVTGTYLVAVGETHGGIGTYNLDITASTAVPISKPPAGATF